jgi:hypothetical protein
MLEGEHLEATETRKKNKRNLEKYEMSFGEVDWIQVTQSLINCSTMLEGMSSFNATFYVK